MIDSEDIERAERIISVVYGQGMERQLEAMQVDNDAFYGVLEHCKEVVRRRYSTEWNRMDPRLEPAIATMFGHAFMLGLVAGRNSGLSPVQ